MIVRRLASKERQLASFAQTMDFVCKGHLLAGISAILSSLDTVFGEVEQ
jgi:NADH:ubiquinone oxidoreductase subunit D